ncbi:efflux RND transporter permease subunit [Natronorubrum sp. DTA28]|uniref:efflux RND transporter permease subunit n=1 Tax=Natronorubrum sp. DTA28 TaxID=3447019 RepID=UPI003F84B388
MSIPNRIADIVTTHSKIVIIALLLTTALVGYGMGDLDDDSSLDQFESESDEAQALEDIDERFESEGDENTTSVQVITRGDNVLTQESVIDSLEFQQEIHANESINATLVENDSITGVENILAITAISQEQAAELEAQGAELEERSEALEQRSAALEEDYAELEADQAALEAGDPEAPSPEELEQRSEELEEREQQLEEDSQQLEEDSEAFEEEQAALQEGDGEQPSLDEQIEALEELDDDEFEELLTDTLSDDGNNDAAALGFMASSYDPGSTQADARMTMVVQQMDGDAMEMGGNTGGVLESQLDLRELANQQDQDYMVFGIGIITDEIDRSMGDSLAIVGPLALLFVVVALVVAYRDPLDIALGVAGIGAVLVWTFGFMGWAGIAFNQMMIAVPVLLIGLSIDYAIHVFMRHREQREADGVSSTVRGSMTIALAGVGVALVWVTATTAIGFLANLVSPIGPIREFGIISSFGILAALIIFGALIPALKVEIDSFLESRGMDRRKRAFGTGEGRFTNVLTLGSTAARKIPVIVLIAALLLTAGGVYGATQVDTSFDEEDFLAESPPAWTEHLPGGMAPGEYQAADDLEFVNQNFQREDTQAQILVEGDITDDDALQRLSDAQDEAAESSTVYTLPNGEADVQGPISVMEETAAQNESFNESYQAATDGDGVPNENLDELYDELFEANEDAASTVLHRTDGGDYESARLIISTQGDASFADTTDEMRMIAGTIDVDGTGDQRNLNAGDGELNAIATGDPIVSYIVEQDLLETVLQSLMITLVAVFGFLTAAYWLTGNSATLGTVTLLPVAFAVSWILGTMHLLDMPFNVLTGMITSLTIGLGVAYSIHVSARYTLELERQGNVWSAMHTTVTGTGGALLGSAATTIGGFGTLAFAILPVLRQFGIITGLTIAYSFLASVIVLPTLLVLWTRYFGPDVSFETSGSITGTPTASDGGTERQTETEIADDARDEEE